MNKEVELRKFLKEKPGYLKWGVDKLSKQFKLSKIKTELIVLQEREEYRINQRKKITAAVTKTSSLPKTRNTKYNIDNVLVIGDIHAPFTRDGYLEFCKNTQKKYDCGTVVFIGDIVDNHFSSYHEIDPDGKSAGDELDLAIEMLKPWHKTFPEAKVCIGNHDALVFRKAKTSGVSHRWIRPFNDVLETHGWDWQMEHEFNKVLYVHGTGSSGEKAAINRAMNLRQSVVQGHLHTIAGVQYNASKNDLIFGFQVGCGIDDAAYAMEYAKHNIKKSIIGCGVVLDKGKVPIFIPMDL